MEIKKVVIPVAGKGTRFLPATKELPKEMIPIINKPMIQYVVEEAINSGVEEVIFVTSRGKEAIEDYFSRNKTLEKFLEEKQKFPELEMCKKIGEMVTYRTVIQNEQLGLGHAILCAEDLIGSENFGVILGDDLILSREPVLKQLMEVSKINNDKSVIGVMEIDGSNERMIAKSFHVEGPTWSPNGRYLMYFKEERTSADGAGGESSLYSIDLTGYNERKIITPLGGSDPAWSPLMH